MKNNPLVSLVITTKNEAKNVDNVMKSILAQTYEPIEIILVDNGSTDRTKEIAMKYTRKVYNKGPERSAQRNYGMIEKSAGKYVMFIDCDMILAPNLIANCVELMSKKIFVALHIPEIVLGKNFWSRVRRFERTFYNGTVIDGARFFGKEKFVKAGGFDESMSGPEDWDIDKKMKKIGKIGLLYAGDKISKWKMSKFISLRGVYPENFGPVIYHNEAEFNLKKYLAKKSYYAGSFDTYIKKWGKNDPDICRQLGLKYRYFAVFIENGKWKKLLAHPILSAGMFYLRFSVGVKFIMRKRN
ncbi:MAG: glycosyltransferase family 2 protein [Candidatus Berkelbacteria bacterium]|nr:glycosyltransferase family 2 protein [Candidatus Berkelbacteria bacterium]